MNTQIQFQVGKFQSYMTTRTFVLGQTGIQVPNGTEILFDGTTVEYGGQRISLPQLRGAMRMGWVVPVGDYDPADTTAQTPQPAGLRLRHAAQGGNPMDPTNRSQPVTPLTASVEEQERTVGNVQTMASDASRRNKNREYRQNPAQYEDQGGIPVRKLKTATRSTPTITAESAGSLIVDATKVQITPGQGITADEMMARMTEGQRAEYLASKAVLSSAYVSGEQVRQVVGVAGSATTRETEGILVRGSVGGGVETADLGGTGGQAATSVVESEGMIFRMTNGPRKDLVAADRGTKGTEATRRKLAKAVCPDFPDLYNFDDPTRKKIARIQADFEDRPDIIRAIFSAETDEVQQRLLAEFPDCFA